MTLRVVFFALLIPLNGGLYWGWKRLASERDHLMEARSGLRRRDQESSETRERERRISVLTKRLGSVPPGELDIALFRDLLIGVERGLELERLSLDFRPGTLSPGGVGRGTIQASLNGSFDALYEYLRRVEALRLPLRPEEVGMRPDSSSGTLVLSVSWTAVWGPLAANPERFSDEDVARLDRWLERKPPPVPGRNLFSGRPSGTGPPHPDSGALERAVVVDESEPDSSRSSTGGTVETAKHSAPTLAGFVLARPELEKDLSRRVLAALRFEGELHLVKIGDIVGAFRVERIEARESVVLVDRATGERLQLFLQ